jgi:hypothetical protein
LICWSPFNFLAYLAPFIFTFWIILATRSKVIIRNTVIFFFCCIYLLVFYKAINSDFVFGNGILSVITYGSFLPIFVIPTKYLTNNFLIKKIFTLICIITILEILLGFVQITYSYIHTNNIAGDYIEGTIHPGLEPEASFSNPIFATIISFSLIFIFSFQNHYGNKKLTILFGVIISLLASVVHVTLFILLAIIISVILYRPNFFRKGIISKIIYPLIILLAVGPVSIQFMRLNKNIGNYYPVFLRLIKSEYPKTLAVSNFYNNETKNNLLITYFGLGPGQYLSRASFISTGKYFGGPLSESQFKIPLTKMTKSFSKNLNDLWIDSIANIKWGRSVISYPHSSWFAILTEFGILGVTIVLFFLVKIIIKTKRNSIIYDNNNLGFFVGSVSLGIFFLGFIENYWEIPQAIFIGLILSKLVYSCLMYPKSIRYNI